MSISTWPRNAVDHAASFANSLTMGRAMVILIRNNFAKPQPEFGSYTGLAADFYSRSIVR